MNAKPTGALAPRGLGLMAITLALTGLLVDARNACGQDDFGTTAAYVLRLPAGTRPIALGNAYTALAGDELSVFYNPASLASTPALSLGASYQSYIVESDLITLSGALPVGPGVLGFGLHNLDYGSVEEVVEDPTFGNQTGQATGAEVGASELVATAGYGIALTSFLGAGIAAKGVRVSIADESGLALATDVGLRAALPTGPDLSLGVSLQNLGSNVELAGRDDPLPRTLRVGAALDLGAAADAFGGLVAVDLLSVRGGATQVAVGAEAGRGFGGVRLTGRAGAHFNNAEESLTDALSFGAGLEFQSFRFDYAYLGFDIFGATHRFGLRWRQPG